MLDGLVEEAFKEEAGPVDAALKVGGSLPMCEQVTSHPLVLFVQRTELTTDTAVDGEEVWVGLGWVGHLESDLGTNGFMDEVGGSVYFYESCRGSVVGMGASLKGCADLPEVFWKMGLWNERLRCFGKVGGLVEDS